METNQRKKREWLLPILISVVLIAFFSVREERLKRSYLKDLNLKSDTIAQLSKKDSLNAIIYVDLINMADCKEEIKGIIELNRKNFNYWSCIKN